MAIYNITHNEDIDGWLSHGIIKQQYPRTIPIGMTYDAIDELDISIFKKHDTVIITDFILPIQTMKYLGEMTNLIWIDHHKSSIQLVEQHDIKFFQKITDTSISACGLTWKFLHPNSVMPKGVEYCTKYDSWTHNNNKSIINFNYGLYSIPDIGLTSYDIWDKVIESDLTWMEFIINRGDSITSYKGFELQRQLSLKGNKCNFEDYKCYCVNATTISSFYMDDYLNKYDMIISFSYNCKEHVFVIGLYSTKIDVSEIASKYGGGGHHGASGFTFTGTFEELKNLLRMK